MPLRLLFRAAIFLAAFLLFVSEPIAAKQLLPVFGGSAAVWMTCLVFFQAALLAGYLYAHAISRAARWQSSLHLGLLALASASAILWSRSATAQPTGNHPVASIFAALAISIGLPFLLLASTSPLLQVWLARVERNPVRFRLFALSNLASLLALLSYPTLIEPRLSLSQQRSLWSIGVCLFALIAASIAWRIRSAPATDNGQRTTVNAVPHRHRILWFLLPMVAAMQLSAVTAHLTSNIAAIPLLWIAPLAVYLLTFILAFQFPQIRAFRGILLRLLAVMLAALGYFLSHTDVALPIAMAIAFFLLEAFLAGLVCHSETYALRPESAAGTTIFYLAVAAGGATGSFLIGIAAPLVFSANYDLALTFLATALVVLAAIWDQAWPQRLLWATGSGLLAFLVFALHTAYHHNTLVTIRNFYGTLRVEQTVTEHGDPIRTLLNGSIQHGTQIFSDDLRRVPTTYYANDSGIGVALLQCCPGRGKRVGVVGLGAGTLAAYGRSGDAFRFYEINPAVLPIAQNLFTWLRESEAQLDFVEGDARASLAAEAPQRFDVLAIDAFSGDAIPLHLVTAEALALYRKHLAPGGILAFHVSNQYVNLEPEVGALAAAAHLQARGIASPEDKQSGELKATWILVSDSAAFFDLPAIAPIAKPIQPSPGIVPWTDNYSSLLPLIRWGLNRDGRP